MKHIASVTPKHDIHYTTPASRWDEGLPCGNGLLGMLVWGDPATEGLNLSVDRSDLWDNRPDPRTLDPKFTWKTLTGLLDEKNMQAIGELFEGGANSAPYPTKLPCGRITLDFGKNKKGTFDSRLDLARAITTTQLGKTTIRAYVHAAKPLIVVRVHGAKPRVKFLSPFDRVHPRSADGFSGGDTARMQYPPPERGKTRDGIEFIRQRCAEGMAYAVAWTSIAKNGDWFLFITVQQEHENRDPVPLAATVLGEARTCNPAMLEKAHVAWWRNYWRKGHIRLPDARIERLWYAEMYKLGACAREDSPPISLQGVWSADEMALPPWRGDYHNDLNTELTYWPVHTSGRIGQSLGFAKWLLKWLPSFQAFARDFYAAPGANVPCSMGLSGAIVRGWAAYVYSRTNGLWLIQHLWLHYRYTMDREFLRDTAYPFIRELTRFAASQVQADAQGVYHLHCSSSPEFFNNWRESFAKDSTYDLSLIRYALETASATANILGIDRDQANEWDRIRARLQPYHVSPENPKMPAPEGGLAIWEGQRLTESHRHLAQCMPIFPLGDVNIEGSDRDRQTIAHTLSELESMGTGFWCGYSFAWMACLAARIREPNRILWALNQYLDAFVSPNSFHLNGDFKNLGASRFHYRPFTLEGNFAAGHAVNEMLLQSWGARIRIFPAVPAAWHNAAFTDLRAEGAFVVSAWRADGEFARAEILSEKGGTIRLEHPFPNRSVVVREAGGKKQRRCKPGQDIIFETQAGKHYIIMASPR